MVIHLFGQSEVMQEKDSTDQASMGTVAIAPVRAPMVLPGLATAEMGYAQKKSGISSYMILPRKIQSALDCIPAKEW